MPYSLGISRFWPWILLSLALHLTAAHFSVGYHFADEHWNVLEFASFKLGHTPAEHLPWEYPSQIRPWLQPGLYFSIARALESLGVTSQKTQTEAFRMFMAVGGWLSVWVLVWAAAEARWFRSPAAARWAAILSTLFWFHPWFHARTSCESFSALFLLLGVAAVLRRRPWIAGLCMGLAFEGRYLVALEPIALCLWVGVEVARKRYTPQEGLGFLGWGGFGIATAVAIGAVVDRWGYGRWVFPAWQYFVINSIEGKSLQFGVYPWYDYVLQALVKMPPVLGGFSLTVLITFWLGFPFHLATAMTLPFIAVHLFIPHKELRFLYPIASFLPLMTAIWIDRLSAELKRFEQLPLWLRRAGRAGAAILMLWNVFYLAFGIFSAEKNRFRYQMMLVDRFPDKLELVSNDASDVYFDPILPIHWGKPKDYRFDGALTPDGALERLRQARVAGQPLWFFHEKAVPTGKIGPFLLSYCKREYCVLPDWLLAININGWVERSQAWSLWRCQ